ncbi:hypothetical protein [Capnocytophaga canis]|uniref:hypothetical protein n=1 Tax=Capnocytophaga canis TaxID=1848903 RepID=UPI001561FD4C|nr:hypothetical protein [Capnocytophaga canis]
MKKEGLLFRERCFYWLLLFLPFVNVITHRIGSVFVYPVVSALLVLSFTANIYSPKKINQDEKKYFLFVLPIFLVGMMYLIATNLVLPENFSDVFFFVFGAILLPILPLFIDIKSIIKRKLSFYLSYVVVVVSVSIMIDYMLLNVLNLIHFQPMYKEGAYSYFDRPFGLFGQPSVNTAIIVVFLMLKKYIDNRHSLILEGIALGAIILQNSGTGYLTLLIYLIALMWQKNKVLLITMGSLVMLGAYFIVMSNVIPKVSAEYLTYNYLFFEFLIQDFFVDVNIKDLLLGFTRTTNVTIDFGPLFMIAKVGLLYFSVFSIYLFILLYKKKSVMLRSSIIALMIANLHYPVMFYIIMHFMWVIIIYGIFVAEKEEENFITETILPINQ